MVEVLAPEKQFERKTKPKAGFSDWQRVAREVGHHSLAAMVERMDPGNKAGVNTHRAIAEHLKELGLPTHDYVAVSINDFLANPEQHFAKVSSGDYYFASIKPGVHLAHCLDAKDVVDFVKRFRLNADDRDRQQEIYLSHNFEPALSGHIIIKPGEQPNPIYAEFTNSNFNSFHRGFSSPEISLKRSRYRFGWNFHGSLETDGDWRDEQVYACNSGLKLNRTQMAEKIFDAISRLPHDEHAFLPGYYEVLIEDIGCRQTRPVFIEANPTSP